MGFSYDTAITTNSDFVNYGFEQEISNFERDSDALANLQKAAVNVIIRDLKGLGIDPADVQNVRDFNMEVVYWCLMTLYAGENPNALPGSSKHDHYMRLWHMERNSRIIVLSDGTVIGGAVRTLPYAENHDSSAYFRAMVWES